LCEALLTKLSFARGIEVVRRIKCSKEQVESNNKKERNKEMKSDINNKVINNYK